MKNLSKDIWICILVIIIGVMIIAGVIYSTRQTGQKDNNCNFSINQEQAEFFLASTTDFILIDQGTAPDPRGLIVFDLKKCQRVYNDRYSKPFEVQGNTVTYWNPIDEPVTEKNCPEGKTYTKQGLGVGIELLVTLDLSTLEKKSLNQFRCQPRQ